MFDAMEISKSTFLGRFSFSVQLMRVAPVTSSSKVVASTSLNLEFLTVTVPEQTLIALLLVADELMNVEFSINPLLPFQYIAPYSGTAIAEYFDIWFQGRIQRNLFGQNV